MVYDSTSDFPLVGENVLDSPWGDEPVEIQNAEWNKLSSDFTNAGYREGITAGKDAALQEGFDAGYAFVGIPLGHELGFLRGQASALHTILSTSPAPDCIQVVEARAIMDGLAVVRFTDIAPRDLEAEQHAREHLEMMDETMDENLGLVERRRTEQVEDKMRVLSAGPGIPKDSRRPTVDDVKALKKRLEILGSITGVALDPHHS
ncbi:hypothetical protein K488DRAFT_60556 [Vararia minispora EC-137]|uniref:Uncharacterized protein n=1 Tax=Vararia minispora EC-137 TaxID=1314806 RepID=A0ACB8Q7X4_9AGAM|nr:hypothetical protein K488DRAFT_60556 [Vararia minispora EC-137]